MRTAQRTTELRANGDGAVGSAAGAGAGAAGADPSAELQRESRRFSAFYEREAYCGYNLALRISGERGAAMGACEQAFLRVAAEAPDLDDEIATRRELTRALVAESLRRARPKVEPADAGEEEAARLLAATECLQAPERAAIALASVGAEGSAELASALELPEERAAKLLDRAAGRFDAALGGERPATAEDVSSWPWARPPDELWGSIYADFYTALERGAASRPGTAAPTKRRATRPKRRSSLLPARAGLAAVVVVAVAAVALALTSFRNGGDDPVGDPAAAGGAVSGIPDAGDGGADAGGKDSGGEALTPEELDELRRQELDALQRYGLKQQREQARERSPSGSPAPGERGSSGGRNGNGNGKSQGGSNGGGEGRAGSKQEQPGAGGATGGSEGGNPAPAPAPTGGGGGGGRGDGESGSKKDGDQTDGKADSGEGKPEGGKTGQCLYDEDSGAFVCPD